MKTSGYLLLGAVGLTLGVGALLGYRRRLRPAQPLERPEGRTLDLNQCSVEDFLDIGLDQESAEHIIEERPYRNKLELLSRMVIPDEIYAIVRNKIFIVEPDEPVKVAS